MPNSSDDIRRVNANAATSPTTTPIATRADRTFVSESVLTSTLGRCTALTTAAGAQDMRLGFMRTLATVVVLSLVGPFVRNALADKIVVYGASGSVGRVIVEEALSRGHEVIGVSRNP